MTTSPTSGRVWGRGDFHVHHDDFMTFSNCFNGALGRPYPGYPSRLADLDRDGDVDGFDFTTFSNCYNGAENWPDCP